MGERMDACDDALDDNLDRLLDEKIMLPATLIGGHAITALFFLLTTHSLSITLLGALLFGWLASIVFGLLLLVIAFGVSVCLAVVHAISSVLTRPSSVNPSAPRPSSLRCSNRPGAGPWDSG